MQKYVRMSSNKYANFRKVVYYYLTDINVNNNTDDTKKHYRSLVVETIYLDDDLLEYRKKMMNHFKNVLCVIDELKYLPPTKIGKLSFQGGYLYHESKL